MKFAFEIPITILCKLKFKIVFVILPKNEIGIGLYLINLA